MASNDTALIISIEAKSDKAAYDINSFFYQMSSIAESATNSINESIKGFSTEAIKAIGEVNESVKALNKTSQDYASKSIESTKDLNDELSKTSKIASTIGIGFSYAGNRISNEFSANLQKASLETNKPIKQIELALELTLKSIKSSAIGISRTIRDVISGDGDFLIEQFTKVKNVILNLSSDIKRALLFDTVKDSVLSGESATLLGATVAFNMNKATSAASKFSSQLSVIAATKVDDLYRRLNLDALDKGLISTSDRLLILGTGFAAIAKYLQNAEGQISRTTGALLELAGKALIAVSLGISFVLIKISDFAVQVGDKIVASLQSSFQLFLKTDQALQTFSATVSNFLEITGGASGSFDEWSNTIRDVGSSFNFTNLELQKASQEIIFVGTQLGLTKEQMMSLLRVSAEYAKINGKSVYDTTVALVQALNGQSQAAVSLGIKLQETNVQYFALKKGLSENINKLSESEKVQIRFNALQEQYNKVAGLGVVAASTLAEQNNRLKVILQDTNQSFGKGVAYVENLYVAQFLASEVLSKLNSGLVEAAGFFSALGGRIFQTLAYMTNFAVKLVTVITAIKALNILLQASSSAGLFESRIKFLNLSLNELASRLAGSQVKITSFGSGAKALTGIMSAVLDTFTRVTFGVKLADASFKTLLSSGIQKLITAFSVLRVVLISALAPLAPYIAIGAAIVGSIVLIWKAIKTLEDQTGTFSRLWALFMKNFDGARGLFDQMTAAFTDFSNFIVGVGYKAFGLVIFALSEMISLGLKLATVFPFKKLFSPETIANLNEIKSGLDGFSERLLASGLDIRNFGETAIASIGDKKKIDVNLEILRKIQSDSEDYLTHGLSTITKAYEERNKVISDALRAELITVDEYNRLKLYSDKLYAEEKKKITDELTEQSLVSNQQLTLSFEKLGTSLKEQSKKMSVTFGEVAKSALSALGNGVGTAFAQFGKALVEGKNAFEAFGKAFLGILGGIAIQLGQFYIAKGIAYMADPLTAAAGPGMIAAGAGLSLLGGVLQAMGDGGASARGASGVTSGVAGPVGDPGLGATPGGIPEMQRQRQTEVVINVQGNVLDRRETGLELASVLQEYFDTSDGVLTRV